MHPHTTKHPGRLEDSVHLPEEDVEGVEEVQDVHAEDAVKSMDVSLRRSRKSRLATPIGHPMKTFQADIFTASNRTS